MNPGPGDCRLLGQQTLPNHPLTAIPGSLKYNAECRITTLNSDQSVTYPDAGMVSTVVCLLRQAKS